MWLAPRLTWAVISFVFAVMARQPNVGNRCADFSVPLLVRFLRRLASAAANPPPSGIQSRLSLVQGFRDAQRELPPNELVLRSFGVKLALRI
jgi:hypothetical protein